MTLLGTKAIPPTDRLAPVEIPDQGRAVRAYIGLALSGLAIIAALMPGVPSGLRAFVLLAFICLGPGASFASLFRFGDQISAWAMAFVLSLAVAGVMPTLMIWTRLWFPDAGYVITAVIAATTSTVALLPRWRNRLTPDDQVEFEEWRSAAPLTRVYLDGAVLLRTLTGPGREPVANATEDRPDATILLPVAVAGVPRFRNPPMGDMARADETSIIPRVPVLADGDLPAVYPGFRFGDATSVLPRVGGSEDLAQATVRVPAQRQPTYDIAASPLLNRNNAKSWAKADSWMTTETGSRWPSVVWELAIVVMTLYAWGYSVGTSSTAGIGDYGLLSIMPPPYFVAFGIAVTRFVLEIASRAPRGWLLTLQTVVVIVMMHATVPLLLDEPEYAWTYKHIGVVEHLREVGYVTNALDIYQQWPGLFALVAQLVDTSGVDTLRFAEWAPLFFDLALVVPLFAIARTLTSDARVPYLTVFLFSILNWVGQDYLSPQAYTYILCFGTILILLRWLRRTATRHSDRMPRLARIWRWAGNGLAHLPYTSKRTSRAATVALVVVFAVVVFSHQLSPYIIIMTAMALVLLGVVRPLRVVPIMLGLALLYLLPRHEIAREYGLFDGFNFLLNARAASPLFGASAGRIFGGDVARWLSLMVWGLAALAAISFWRKPGRVAAPAVLAFSPFALLVLQSYGGEAIYRVYLFALPWCALLIATLVLRDKWLPRKIALPGAVLALLVAVFGTIQCSQGQLSVNQFSKAEVQAAKYIYTNAEPGSNLVMVAGNFPTRLIAGYDRFAGGPNDDLTLVNSYEKANYAEFTDEGANLLTQRLDTGPPVYLVFAPAMTKYIHFFGYLPDGTVEKLHTNVRTSPHWTLYYHVDDVWIYKLAENPNVVVNPNRKVE